MARLNARFRSVSSRLISALETGRRPVPSGGACLAHQHRADLALCHKLPDIGRGDRGHAAALEERHQVLRDAPLGDGERTLPVDTIVVEHVLGRFLEP